MRIREYDKAILAIQDGEYDALLRAHQNVPDKTLDLLPLAAARPGPVGRDMTIAMLLEARDVPQDIYLAVCKNAIATGDTGRVLTLAREAGNRVKDLDMSLYGEIIGESLTGNKKNIANALLEQCEPEQLRASDPSLLTLALRRNDYSMAYKLAESGLDANPRASEIIRALTPDGNSHSFSKHLVERVLQVDNSNYNAMFACIDTENYKVAELLIDRGMDFDAFTKWATDRELINNVEAFDRVKEYWQAHKQVLDQSLEQEPGPEQGPTMAGV
jgi:hypothetical protein